jgi:phage shock protein PspC (stress-responsive transcriptional regulator)
MAVALVKGISFCPGVTAMTAADTADQPYVALPMRSHTILGVCEALGEDFGISPAWLRIPLAASVLYSPLGAIAAYLILGVVVLGSRLVFPRRVTTVAVEKKAVDAANSEADVKLAA